MAKNILLEVTPYNPATDSTVTLRMSWVGADSTGVVVGGYQWLPCITQGPVRTATFFGEGQLQPIGISHGDISMQLCSAFNNEVWSTYSWDGALGRVYIGNMGDAFASYTQIFEGSTGPLVGRDNQIATVTLFGREEIVDTPLLTSTYAGTGGAEGIAGLLGEPKPWASGTCQNITPVLIDPVYMIYQYHGYGATNDVTMVYENAIQVNATSAATYTTYATLAAATLTEGQWAKAPAVGMFRLGAAPRGKVTADVQGAKNGATYVSAIGTIVPHLLSVAGLSGTYYDTASIGAFTQSWSYYTTEQKSIGEICREALFHAGGYLFPSSTGVFKAGNYLTTKTAVALKKDRSALPLVGNVKQLTPASPCWKLKIGADRNYSVHSDSEISPAIFDAAADASAAQAAADAAQADADLAQADATAANARLASIANDNVLDRVDKYQVITDYSAIIAEQSGIDAQATALSITTEKTTYDSAVTALTTYLTGLSPAYTDTTQDTTIVGTTFRTKFTDVYTSRQALLNKIADQSRYWANVTGTGKPSDNAGTTLTLTALGTTPPTITGNTIVRAGGGDGFVSAAVSQTPFRGAAYAVCDIAQGGDVYTMVGLDNDATSYAREGAVNALLQYRSLNGFYEIWVNGSLSFNSSTTAALSGTMTVTYDGVNYQFYINQTLIATVPTTADQTLYAKWYLYNSSITLKGLRAGFSTDRAWSQISGTGKPSDYAGSNFTLTTTGSAVSSITVTGNTITQITTGASWNAVAYSSQSYVGTAFVSCRFTGSASGANGPVIGFATDANKSSSNYTSTAYGLYFSNMSIYYMESGSYVFLGAYVAGDVWSIIYDGVNVRYLQNGTTQRTVAASSGQVYYLKAVFDTNGAINNVISDIQFGPYTENFWGSIGGAGRPSDYAGSNFSLIAGGETSKLTIVGNTITQTASTATSWNAWAYTEESYTGTAYASCKTVALTGDGPLFGLATSANKNLTNYTSISYGFHRSTTLAYAIEGAAVYHIGSVADGDLTAVVYDGVNVSYLKNGTVLRTVAAGSGLTFHGKASFNANGSATNTVMSNMQFGPYTDNAWTTIGGTGKPADNATRNVATYSSSAPSSPVDGDIWVDTSGTYVVFKLRSGGAWQTGANALTAYTNLTGKPVALADINTTESTKLTGIEVGADVTSYIDGGDITVEADSAGTVLTGQLPKSSAMKLWKNGTQVTGPTWSCSILSGTMTASIDSTGSLSVDASSGTFTSGKVRVTAVYTGTTRTRDVTVTKNLAPPTAGGSGGSGSTTYSASAVGYTINSTSPQVMSDELTVTVGSTGTVSLACNYSFSSTMTNALSGLHMNAQIYKWNGSSYVALSSNVQSSSGFYYNSGSGGEPGEGPYDGEGSVTHSDTGNTVGSTQKYKVYGQTTSGTRARYPYGTFTGTVS